MKPKAALIGADSIVVLHPVATLYANIAIVVFPTDAEAHNTIRLRDPAEDLILVIDLFIFDVVKDVLRDLIDGLVKLGFPGVALFNTFHEFFAIDVV